MDIYIIPPNSHLELMNHGDRFFCLAQQYIKHQHYREFFKQKVKDGAWVTLDNGAGDHDVVSAHELYKVMADLHPSEVIPPDYLFDGVKTVRSLETFIPPVLEHNRLVMGKKIEIFACPQGADKDEWLFSYRYMLDHPGVNTIGFSKIAVPFAFLGLKGDRCIKEARHMAYQELSAKKMLYKPIHCLGAGDPTEFKLYKNNPIMRSTDSCFSVWSGMNLKDWQKGEFERVPTPKDYFDREVTPFQMVYVETNIEYLQDLMK